MFSSSGFDVVYAALQECFGDIDFAPAPLLERASGPRQMCVCVPPDRLLEVMQFLYEDERCRFNRLSDLNGIDYLDFPEAADRFAVTYTLHSMFLGHWLWVKTFVNGLEGESATFELPAAVEIERSGRLDQRGAGRPQMHPPPDMPLTIDGRGES